MHSTRLLVEPTNFDDLFDVVDGMVVVNRDVQLSQGMGDAEMVVMINRGTIYDKRHRHVDARVCVLCCMCVMSEHDTNTDETRVCNFLYRLHTHTTRAHGKDGRMRRYSAAVAQDDEDA